MDTNKAGADPEQNKQGGGKARSRKYKRTKIKARKPKARKDHINLSILFKLNTGYFFFLFFFAVFSIFLCVKRVNGI